MKKLFQIVRNFYQFYLNFMTNYGASLLLLAIRMAIGLVFLKSGLTKFSNVNSAILLFKYEYSVPLVPPALAAYSAMFFEISCGFALIVGLFTRIAALPLIGMTLVIQFLVFQNPEHFYWLYLLLVLAIYGAGKISLDGIFEFACRKGVLSFKKVR